MKDVTNDMNDGRKSKKYDADMRKVKTTIFVLENNSNSTKLTIVNVSSVTLLPLLLFLLILLILFNYQDAYILYVIYNNSVYKKKRKEKENHFKQTRNKSSVI